MALPKDEIRIPVRIVDQEGRVRILRIFARIAPVEDMRGTHRFKLAFHPEVNIANRISFGQRTFSINEATPDEDNGAVVAFGTEI